MDVPIKFDPKMMADDKAHWLAYYSECNTYLLSLHTQVIALLALQGAVAAGCLAAMKHGLIALLIGFVGATLEVLLGYLLSKFFTQCDKMCYIMRRIESEALKLDAAISLKVQMTQDETKMFSSPELKHWVLAIGGIFALGILATGVYFFIAKPPAT